MGQTFTKKQENQLLAIPHGRASSQKIKEWAAQNGRSYGSAWQKHYALHGRPGSNPIVPVKTNKKVIPPMTFTAVDFDGGRSKVNDQERISMEKGLDSAITGPLSSPKRAILFPKRLMNRAKAYLIKKYPRNVFSFHSKGGDKVNMLLTKRM